MFEGYFLNKIMRVAIEYFSIAFLCGNSSNLKIKGLGVLLNLIQKLAHKYIPGINLLEFPVPKIGRASCRERVLVVV